MRPKDSRRKSAGRQTGQGLHPAWIDGSDFLTREKSVIERTSVGKVPARWVHAPITLNIVNPRGGTLPKPAMLVDGNALLWLNLSGFYRVETTLPLAEARRIAESLR